MLHIKRMLLTGLLALMLAVPSVISVKTLIAEVAPSAQIAGTETPPTPAPDGDVWAG